jgi:hypothetical protein
VCGWVPQNPISDAIREPVPTWLSYCSDNPGTRR